MGATDHIPDYNPLLRYVLKMDAVKILLSNAASRNEDNISNWQGDLFEFRNSLAPTFNVDVSTEMNTLIRHMNH